MTSELQQLSSILKTMLEQLTPILSGNMQQQIIKANIVNISDNEVTFCIEAPFYDLKKWKEEGVIIHTGKTYHGMSDYANIVNQFGGFAKKNKSMFWVNRVCNQAAETIPNAEIINELEL